MSDAASTCPSCGGQQSVSALGDVICENGCHKEPSAACWCCGEPAPIRGEDDPWEGRLDGYCVSCATTRCDTTDSTCAVKSAATPSRPACIECVMAWLLYGDGAICLYHQERVFSKGSKR